jgi:hypothetical protein
MNLFTGFTSQNSVTIVVPTKENPLICKKNYMQCNMYVFPVSGTSQFGGKQS